MITSAYDDMVIIWNLETGSILKRIWLKSSETLIRSIHYQDDQVFTSGLDKRVRQIDLLSGKVVRTITGIGDVLCIAAGPDFLFVGREQSPYALKFNTITGAAVLRLDGHSGPVVSLFLSDNWLFSGSFDTTINCWNAVNGVVLRKYIGHSHPVYTVAIFDGELYSTASVTELFKWSIDDAELRKTFTAVHEQQIYCLAYKSQYLFTGSYDTKVIRWNVVSGDALFIYSGRKSFIRGVVSWKNFLISGGDDAVIRIWDSSTEAIDPYAVIDNNHVRINSLFILDDVSYFGDSDGNIRVISLPTFTLITTFEIPGDSIESFAGNKFVLYGGGYSGFIYQWNVSSSVQTSLFKAHSAQIRSLQLFDNFLYSSSLEIKAKAWNTKTFEIVSVFEAIKMISTILTSQDYLIACTAGSVEIFDLVAGTKKSFVEACLSVVSRGNIVYTGHLDSLIRVRNVISLIPYETYKGHLDWVMALCFDEAFNLFSAGYDGAIKKWNFASRNVAFSFENRSSSVSSLAACQNQLFVGLKGGRIVYYNLEDTLSLGSFGYHNKAISSLVTFNGSIYSSSFDGNFLKFSSTGNGNFTTVYKSNHEPLKGISLESSFWIALQGDNKIIFSPIDLSSGSTKVIDYQTPLACVAATETYILAGSKSGILYAWGVERLQLAFELKGHVSPVNDLLVIDDRLFSASHDKTIIEWSLENQLTRKTYKRLSASALGHLGPVNSLSYCSETLFSGGSDLTVRRWNTNTGRHDDVYFGFAKSVTTVLCYNRSVFAGSEDFSVLMFNPILPQNQGVAVKSTTTIRRKTTNRKRLLRLQRAEGSTMNVSFVLVSVTAVVVAIIITIFGYALFKRRAKKIISPPEKTTLIYGTASTQTIMDLQTVVNSVMGISKHAAYLIDNSALAKVKKIAAGGGGELFLAKIMDPLMRKRIPEIVIQKIVFVKSKINEESFYQEVGIMILLSSFPNFCQIIGYTENPLSMVLKNYPGGSLYDWASKNYYGTKIILKILKDTASALSVMHSHYLAHCDLKPQNILVEVDNGLPSCFLTDFGITQILSEKIIATKAFHIINLRGLSTHYAAPEAFINFRTKQYAKVDFKAYDIYSFGCIPYELLSRCAPWE